MAHRFRFLLEGGTRHENILRPGGHKLQRRTQRNRESLFILSEICLKSGHCVCYKSSRVVRLEYEIRLNGRLLNAKPPGPHLYRLQWPFCEPCLPDWQTPPQVVGKKLVGTASAALGQPTSPFVFDRDPNSTCFSKSTFTAEFSCLIVHETSLH